MAEINYDPNNGYVENFMFGSDFKLHSVLGELWADFGVPGAVLGLTIGVLLVHALAALVARRQASAVVAFLVFWTLWNLLFSPVYGSTPTLILALGLGLVTRDLTRPAPELPEAQVPVAAGSGGACLGAGAGVPLCGEATGRVTMST
jgi:hypothetical protein